MSVLLLSKVAGLMQDSANQISLEFFFEQKGRVRKHRSSHNKGITEEEISDQEI
jgi:hypothetical protein